MLGGWGALHGQEWEMHGKVLYLLRFVINLNSSKKRKSQKKKNPENLKPK